MFNIILSTITKGGYKLSEMLAKIETMWISGKLTDEERESLIEQARNHTEASNEYAPLIEQINEAFAEIEALKARVTALESEGGESEGDGKEPPAPAEEYPPYKQPTGAHNAYNTGDKITWNGKHYTCQMNGCVWNPDDYPQGWKEITEEK